MTNRTVVVAGATGVLGIKVVSALLAQGASVTALVRSSSRKDSVARLQKVGASVHLTDFQSASSFAQACEGSDCVVSTIAGLRHEMVEVQSTLLNGVVTAGVPRFIPSDFAIDLYRIPPGSNRNLEFRREFAAKLEEADVSVTSVLNGMFSEFIFTPAPFILFSLRRCLYFGDGDQLLDFTAIDDVATYTARVALDDYTPRFLRVAGNVLAASDLAAEAEAATGKTFKVTRAGGIGTLEFMMKAARYFSRGTSNLYPAFQGMQYAINMYSGDGKLDPLDNDRYPGVRWTPLRETIQKGPPTFIP